MRCGQSHILSGLSGMHTSTHLPVCGRKMQELAERGVASQGAAQMGVELQVCAVRQDCNSEVGK